MSPYQTKNNGLSFTAYVGDSSVLLAFDLDDDKTHNLAGFAIKAKTPDKGPYPTNEYWLKNMLNFKEGLTSNVELTPDKAVESNIAPFQSFHWVHFPGAGPGQYTYTVYPCYFANDSNSPPTLDPEASLSIDLTWRSLPDMELGFTRGLLSSQAYVDRFKNASIEPKAKSIDFDTTPYQPQYEWLGAHAREMTFDFLKECEGDPSMSIDVFSYDLDEPDIIRAIAAMGARARVLQDNSTLHTKKGALEPDAVEAFKQAGVAVKTGHFYRFAHDKVMIQKKSGNAVKVLTGSMNFSIRGVYVQANSVLIFDNPQIVGLYEQAFEEAFTDMSGFRSSNIASKWFDVTTTDNSLISLSFAPHETSFSVDTVSQAIESAKSSVLFAVMQMEGGGPVMPALENLGSRDDLLSLGTIDTESELKLFKKGVSSGVTSKGWLKENAPPPFQSEMSGGMGHIIHHKFIVCDFNDKNPVVFCGSSNLAAVGETDNGDNLIAIHHPNIVYSYAVEAIRLYDHYQFRSNHENSTSNNPLTLDTSDNWVKPYYDPNDLKFHERKLFSMSS